MRGPCMCGDPYCASCGNPGLAELEAAEERLSEECGKLALTSEEYQNVIDMLQTLIKVIRAAKKQERESIQTLEF